MLEVDDLDVMSRLDLLKSYSTLLGFLESKPFPSLSGWDPYIGVLVGAIVLDFLGVQALDFSVSSNCMRSFKETRGVAFEELLTQARPPHTVHKAGTYDPQYNISGTCKC